MKPTYKEKFNQLTQAYIKGDVFPYDQRACFVGNLLNNNGEWAHERNYNNTSNKLCIPEGFYSLKFINNVLYEEVDSFYTPEEIDELEKLFLPTYEKNGGRRWNGRERIDEDALFKAFEVTLDLLKEIHISKGEVIDEALVFVKRQLNLVI